MIEDSAYLTPEFLKSICVTHYDYRASYRRCEMLVAFWGAPSGHLNMMLEPAGIVELSWWRWGHYDGVAGECVCPEFRLDLRQSGDSLVISNGGDEIGRIVFRKCCFQRLRVYPRLFDEHGDEFAKIELPWLRTAGCHRRTSLRLNRDGGTDPVTSHDPFERSPKPSNRSGSIPATLTDLTWLTRTRSLPIERGLMGKLTGFEFSDDRHEILQRRPTAHQKPLFANFGALAEEPPARRLVVLIAMFWARLINLP